MCDNCFDRFQRQDGGCLGARSEIPLKALSGIGAECVEGNPVVEGGGVRLEMVTRRDGGNLGTELG